MKPIIDPYEALQYCINICTATTDKSKIHEAVVDAIRVAVNRDRSMPAFLTYGDLEIRWKLQRKAIERLNLPTVKIGGSNRFSREDILIFEHLHRSNDDTRPGG